MSNFKILTKNEVADNKTKEIERDARRLESVRQTLVESQSKLDDVNAKFDLAFAKQHAQRMKAEEDHLHKIDELNKEIKVLEEKRNTLLIPIDNEINKAHTLFEAADACLKDAHQARKEVDEMRKENEEQAELLKERLDGLSEKEAEVTLREQKVQVQEENLKIEQNQLKSLSTELLSKLRNL